MRGRPDPNWPALDPNRYGVPAGARRAAPNPNSFSFSFWQIKDGETEIVANRLVEIFSAAGEDLEHFSWYCGVAESSYVQPFFHPSTRRPRAGDSDSMEWLRRVPFPRFTPSGERL